MKNIEVAASCGFLFPLCSTIRAGGACDDVTSDAKIASAVGSWNIAGFQRLETAFFCFADSRSVRDTQRTVLGTVGGHGSHGTFGSLHMSIMDMNV